MEYPTEFAIFTFVDVERNVQCYRRILLCGNMMNDERVFLGFDGSNPQYKILIADLLDKEPVQLEFPSKQLAQEAFKEKCILLHPRYHRLNISFVNIEHLISKQPTTQNVQRSEFLIRALNEYMPRGVPNSSVLQSAREILTEIKNRMVEEQGSFPCIQNRPIIDVKSDLYGFIIEKSNEFYQRIPNDINNYHKAPRDGARPPIETFGLCQAKAKVVGRLESVLNALNDAVSKEGVNAIDYFCTNYLEVQLTQMPLDPVISDIGMTDPDGIIKNVFKVEKRAWNEAFDNVIGNNHYLFHSTHLANTVGILKEGLLVSPDHIFSYNNWIGQGIYFHASSQSIFNFAKRVKHNMILVCRVALGNQLILKDYPFIKRGEIFALTPNQHSIKVPGTVYQSSARWSPEQQIYLPGTDKQYDWITPSYLLNHASSGFPYGDFDEHLVQKANQVKIEYIIELN